jgi:hypothetical protein
VEGIYLNVSMYSMSVDVREVPVCCAVQVAVQ